MTFIKLLDKLIISVGGFTIGLYRLIKNHCLISAFVVLTVSLVSDASVMPMYSLYQPSRVISIQTTPTIDTDYSRLRMVSGLGLSSMEKYGELKDLIRDEARRAGVSPEYMLILAFLESSFRTKVTAKQTGAKGLFQFTPTTWDYLIDKYNLPEDALRTDPKYSARVAALYIRHAESVIGEHGINDSYTYLYLTHFLGPTGVTRLINANLSDSAVDLFEAAASRNQAVFFENGEERTVRELINYINTKIVYSKRVIKQGRLLAFNT